MEPDTQLGMILDLCDRLEIPVREEHLGGAGGGLCTVRNKRMLFVDLDADSATQARACLASLANLPELDAMYIPPALREALSHL